MRAGNAQERGAMILPETVIEKPRNNPRVSAIKMQESRTLLRDAERHLSQGRLEDAERSLIQALTARPDADDVREALADLYLKTERFQKAEALLRELIETGNDPGIYAKHGEACLRLQKFDVAIESYSFAYDRDPHNLDRAAALGQAYSAAGDCEHAIPLLEKVVARSGNNVDLLQLLADCYQALDQNAAAQEMYRRLNKVRPYDEEVKEKLVALSQ